jgi:excisionase family DNA binding protein
MNQESSHIESLLLTTDQAAALINVKAATLRQWRSRGQGPNYTTMGKLVRYRKTDLLRFAGFHLRGRPMGGQLRVTG